MSRGGLALLAVAALAALAYFGAFYDTGRLYYEACWAKKEAEAVSPSGAKAADPYTAARWERCETTTERALYKMGFIFADYGGVGALGKACPSRWYEVPINGAYYLTVEFVGEQGGVSLLDNFLPAEKMIQRVWLSHWPSCNAERQRESYPKLIETSPGQFDWDAPCIPCKN
jgi:hypothetical protein